MEQIRVLRAEAEADARSQGDALKDLGAMVGQMTARTVLQAARELAAKGGRSAPEGSDVDAAIAAMADAVPAEVADELWAQRDAFMDSTRAD
jgi:histone H3/H4